MTKQLETLDVGIQLFNTAVSTLILEFGADLPEIEASLALARAAILDAMPVLGAPSVANQHTIDRAYLAIGVIAAFIEREIVGDYPIELDHARDATFALLEAFKPFIGRVERTWLESWLRALDADQPFHGDISRLS